MGLKQNFAANLRHWRKVRGLSQEALAHRADIDRTYVSSLERLKYSATLDMIELLASALDIDPLLLLGPPPVKG